MSYFPINLNIRDFLLGKFARKLQNATAKGLTQKSVRHMVLARSICASLHQKFKLFPKYFAVDSEKVPLQQLIELIDFYCSDLKSMVFACLILSFYKNYVLSPTLSSKPNRYRAYFVLYTSEDSSPKSRLLLYNCGGIFYIIIFRFVYFTYLFS